MKITIIDGVAYKLIPIDDVKALLQSQYDFISQMQTAIQDAQDNIQEIRNKAADKI